MFTIMSINYECKILHVSELKNQTFFTLSILNIHILQLQLSKNNIYGIEDTLDMLCSAIILSVSVV